MRIAMKKELMRPNLRLLCAGVAGVLVANLNYGCAQFPHPVVLDGMNGIENYVNRRVVAKGYIINESEFMFYFDSNDAEIGSRENCISGIFSNNVRRELPDKKVTFVEISGLLLEWSYSFDYGLNNFCLSRFIIVANEVAIIDQEVR